MDVAQVLVRSVVRAFYDTEAIVILDALVTHSALSISDLAKVLNREKGTKEVSKACGKLKEAGLISVHARQEVREGAQKPSTREYYYIDYRRAIDATKYRIHMIDEQVKRISKPTQEKKELVCRQCGAQWTTMEVIDNMDQMAAMTGRGSGFLCNTCGHPLTQIAYDAEPEADDLPALFNKQFRPFLSLLQQIDQTVVPAVTGEQAFADARPLPRDLNVDPGVKSEAVSQPRTAPSAVKGITSGPEKIEISITSNSENTAAEAKAEAERRARIAAQNALPEWHTHSTVTAGERTAASHAQDGVIRERDSNTPLNLGDDAEDEDKKTKDPSLDAYFAELAAEQERERLKKEAEADEDEETDEDEEEDEFEDVVAVPETNGTPEAKRARLDDQPAPVQTSGTGDTTSAPNSANVEESDEDDFEDAI